MTMERGDEYLDQNSISKPVSLQVLIATMNQENYIELCDHMNIHSDVLIINQSDEVNYHCTDYNGYKCESYSFNERGLSRSRNNAIMRATGDIICLADDDMRYTDTYAMDIMSEFNKHPEADAIVFNVELIGGDRIANPIKQFDRVGKRESREYGSVHIAMRREKILFNNLFFNIMFGSGAYYRCGEDTIFLKNFLDCGLKLYKSPVKIGVVDMKDSTWFKGYNEKFFFDKGAVIGATYPHISSILVLIQAFRNSKSKIGSYKHFAELYKWYKSGLMDYRERT